MCSNLGSGETNVFILNIAIMLEIKEARRRSFKRIDPKGRKENKPLKEGNF